MCFNPRSRVSERHRIAHDAQRVIWFQSALARERATSPHRERSGNRQFQSALARERATVVLKTPNVAVLFQSALARERATCRQITLGEGFCSFNPRSRVSERRPDSLVPLCSPGFQSALARERATSTLRYYDWRL